MKCANCGAELKVGCIYCSACGKEAQIVSDYNLLEDDFLRDMLKEREEKIKREAAAKAYAKKTAGDGHVQNTDRAAAKSGKHGSNEAEGKSGRNKRRVKKRIIFAVLAIVLLIILIVVTVLMVNYGRENSYVYQMDQAKACIEDMNYRKAQEYVQRALELEEDSLEAELLLADIYVLRGEESTAVTLLREICRENKDNQKAYQSLIDLYAGQKDYESIQELSREVQEEEILDLFSEYLPGIPEFDTEDGVYTQEFFVGISVEEGNRIYYTVDNTDPRQGMEYQEPIRVSPGETVQIRAVAKNNYDLYGDEVTGQFQVELQKPAKPRVSPSGGSFYDAQKIVVTVPDGARVYYTWDGTTPDTLSDQYMEPLSMPEGNNILSLILVDEYGMKSDVMKCNYIYMPMTQNSVDSE